jgi:hypothetical protein
MVVMIAIIVVILAAVASQLAKRWRCVEMYCQFATTLENKHGGVQVRRKTWAH